MFDLGRWSTADAKNATDCTSHPIDRRRRAPAAADERLPDKMSPMRPTARRLARKLVLLPVLVIALLVVLVPATASGPRWDNPGNGSAAVDTHQPYGVGQGRKIK
jgi:hypothetical protein